MSEILVVAELSEGGVRKATHSAIACARRINELSGGSFSILVLGGPGTKAAAAQGFQVVVGTASSYGKDLLPRVAARLDAAYAADCSDVVSKAGKLAYKRPMFAGNAYGFCTLDTPQQVVSVRQSEFDPAQPTAGQSPVSDLALPAPGAAAQRIEFVSLEQVK